MKQGNRELFGEVVTAILIWVILLAIVLYGFDWTGLSVCGDEICRK